MGLHLNQDSSAEEEVRSRESGAGESLNSVFFLFTQTHLGLNDRPRTGSYVAFSYR
jgi:hypothetical protein